MRRTLCVLVIVALSACADEVPTGAPIEVTEHRGKKFWSDPEYDVVTLPSAGAGDQGIGINRAGWVAGFTDRGDDTREAILWLRSHVIELGTLGGPSSAAVWPGLNDWGMVVGISQTGEPDTLNEHWSCERGGFLPETNPRQVCRGFFWAWGKMYDLPTLGGTHGFATNVNNRGQVVGWAETTVRDPTCVGVQVLQFRAVKWEPLRGKAEELPPFPGDSASAAVAINNRGQAVGISGDCDQAVGRFSARRAVLWERDGEVSEIPNLGGRSWHTPMDINERGDVVGFSNPPGEDPEGAFIARAFYWRHGSERAKDLGALDGNTLSQALGINNKGDIVGASLGGTEPTRGFIWRNGKMEDLNDLVDLGDAVIQTAESINDRGQITGRLEDQDTGEIRAYIATPRGGRSLR